ncbi:hypothetical protein BD779DRAFT_1680284 [Infundibulicybe gibba]|nr:hypothetical protein BD779DRAFT_1680284 [Infundibulicybe gibba]
MSPPAPGPLPHYPRDPYPWSTPPSSSVHIHIPLNFEPMEPYNGTYSYSGKTFRYWTPKPNHSHGIYVSRTDSEEQHLFPVHPLMTHLPPLLPNQLLPPLFTDPPLSPLLIYLPLNIVPLLHRTPKEPLSSEPTHDNDNAHKPSLSPLSPMLVKPRHIQSPDAKNVPAPQTVFSQPEQHCVRYCSFCMALDMHSPPVQTFIVISAIGEPLTLLVPTVITDLDNPISMKSFTLMTLPYPI